MTTNSQYSHFIAQSWNTEQADKSLQRWLELAQQQHWGEVPADMRSLCQIFGASWYFSRFIFYRGDAAAKLIDSCAIQDVCAEQIRREFDACPEGDMEAVINTLAMRKNAWMLKILICYLRAELGLQQMELLLTTLAEAVFIAFFHYVMRPAEIQQPGQPGQLGQPGLAVLAMGRMSGYEMTFGSDLDLVFLYEDSTGLDSFSLSRHIQKVLRYVGSMTPVGMLYDVDMRLRPHGTAGVLVTSVSSFIDYHAQARDIWERQMMTRCRVIYDPDHFAEAVMEKVNHHIYQQYSQPQLLAEIATMRAKVQLELGQPRDKYEVKRGRGGLMDIDFISHYLQLLHAHTLPVLQTSSTRSALDRLRELNLIPTACANSLLESYDYLKTIEMVLRLWDMKSIDSFSFQHEKNVSLAKALGYPANETEAFINSYVAHTDTVRKIFEQVLKPL